MLFVPHFQSISFTYNWSFLPAKAFCMIVISSPKHVEHRNKGVQCLSAADKKSKCLNDFLYCEINTFYLKLQCDVETIYATHGSYTHMLVNLQAGWLYIK